MKSLDSLPSTHPEITGADVQEYCRKRNLTVIQNELLHEMQRSWSETAQPDRKTGRWEKVYGEHIRAGHRPWTVCCSECGMIGGGTRYCPNCGADMRTPTQVQLDEADDVMMGGGNG